MSVAFDDPYGRLRSPAFDITLILGVAALVPVFGAVVTLPSS